MCGNRYKLQDSGIGNKQTNNEKKKAQKISKDNPFGLISLNIRKHKIKHNLNIN